MAQLMVEVSGARTGSTNFARIVDDFSNIAMFHEYFHPNFRIGDDTLAPLVAAGRARGHALSGDAEELRSFVRGDIEEGVRILLDAADAEGADYGFLKLSPLDLTFGELAALVRAFEPPAILLHRAPIDMYISLTKAWEVAEWENADTTGLKPKLDAAKYGRWYARNIKHYQLSRHLLTRAGCPVAELAYAELYNPEVDQVDLMARTFAELGVDAGSFQAETAPLVRQDRGGARADKVSNWDEFVEQVTEMGLADTFERFDLEGSWAALERQRLVEQYVPETVRKGGRSLRELAKAASW